VNKNQKKKDQKFQADVAAVESGIPSIQKTFPIGKYRGNIQVS
jgi:hypothetical protein